MQKEISKEQTKEDSIEENCKRFKNIIVMAAKESCGTTEIAN